MSVEIYHGERSEESIQFETLFASQSNKESFSSIEHTKNFLSKKEWKIRSLMPLEMM